jgi:hypothetical protein
MNTTTAKSLAILQNVLEKAPDSAKPALEDVIRRTKKAHERAQQQLKLDDSKHLLPSGVKPDIIPAAPAGKPKYIPPANNNHKLDAPLPLNKRNLQNGFRQGSVDNQTNNAYNDDDDDKYNQTNTADNSSNDNRYNQTQPATNMRLPALVNPVIK